MKTPVIVAIVDGEHVRVYVRQGTGALDQKAQLAVADHVAPAAFATIIADLGDEFGWLAKPVVEKAPKPKAVTKVKAEPKPKVLRPRRTREQMVEYHDQLVAAVAARPSTMSELVESVHGGDVRKHIVLDALTRLVADGRLSRDLDPDLGVWRYSVPAPPSVDPSVDLAPSLPDVSSTPTETAEVLS